MIEFDEDGSKTTAEDFGTYWLIKEWEFLEDEQMWLDNSGYTISKNMIEKLHATSDELDGLRKKFEALRDMWNRNSLSAFEDDQDALAKIMYVPNAKVMCAP